MKKKYSIWIAPAAVLLIIMSVFLSCRMFPFGGNTLAWCDMNQQVIPFLMDFKDILAGKANLFLNLQNAGGMNFWGVFLFFISSPFTFLVAFVSKADMYFFVNILVTLKMMLCAFTASIFFNRQFQKLTSLQSATISVMYAFCGYAMFYYQNQVWLDMMYLFPVLLIGLIKLVDEDKPLLYILSFSMILTVNFYLSYMVSIFLVLFIALYVILLSPRSRERKNILLTGISTLIVVCITAAVWLPSLMQYLNSARTSNLITSLRSGSFFTRFDTTVALIACTGAILSALMMHFLFGSKDRKKTAFVLCIFILTLIPVFIEPINKMWHTGNYQAFPVRYGYITIFFGIILLAGIICDINQEHSLAVSQPLPLLGGIASVGAVLIAAIYLLYKDYGMITVYTKTLWGNSQSFSLLIAFSLLASLAYFVILLLYKYQRLGKIAFSVFLCVLVVLECVFNASVYVSSAANSGKSESAVIDLSDKIKDDSLYRVKMNKKYFDVNLMGSLGYNTLSHYTSLTDENYMYTMKKLGYSSYWMEVNSNGGTKLTDAILGNKYSVIKKQEITAEASILYQNEEYAIKQNEFTLPIGFIMNTKQIKADKKLPDTTRLDRQQKLFQELFHTDENLFVHYEPTSLFNIYYHQNPYYELSFSDGIANGAIEYQIPVKGKQTLYFDCFDRLTNSLIEHINGSFNIFVDGQLVEAEYPNQLNNGLLNLGTFTDQTVSIEIEVLKDVNAKSFGVAGLKEDVLQNAINSVQSAQLHQVNNSLIGTASSNSEDSYLFLPLTYDKGFTATVNQKQAEIIRVFDSMMAVKLEKGQNQISVHYLPAGFKTGICLSLAGVVLCILFLLILKKGYERLKFLELPAQIVFSILSAGIFIIVYIFPLIIYFK